MTFPFKNLVFEDGGVKGIAFVGAMKVLEDDDWHRTPGFLTALPNLK